MKKRKNRYLIKNRYHKKHGSILHHNFIYILVILCVLNGIWNIRAESNVNQRASASEYEANEKYFNENMINEVSESERKDKRIDEFDEEKDISTPGSEDDAENDDVEEFDLDEPTEDAQDSDTTLSDGNDDSDEEDPDDKEQEGDDDSLSENLFLIDQENADQFQANDEESQELLQEILDGEQLGFVLMENADFEEGLVIETEIIDSDSNENYEEITVAETMKEDENEISVDDDTDEWISEEVNELDDTQEQQTIRSEVLLSSLYDSSYNLKNGSRIYCDEVWTKANDYINGNRTRMSTTYRTVSYTDLDGNSKTAPIYCMNAMKDSISSGKIDASGIKSVNNNTVKKLLYYGYGGPGDYCDQYDPTCSHINWSNWHNRYVFTHQAISKSYANDVGGATAAEIEHVGLNRFISKLTSLKLPSRNATLLNAVLPTSEREVGQTVSVEMPLYHGYSDYKSYMPANYKNGYYLSEVVIVSDTESPQFGIKINHKTSSQWTVFYWTSYNDYVERGFNNPRVCSGDQVLNIKHSGRFRIGIPAAYLKSLNFKFPLIQNPVSYLLVDTSEIYHDTRYQDFGSTVYQGEKKILNLVEAQTPQGTLKIAKTDSTTMEPVESAQYSLYADENLISAGRTVYRKDTLIDQKMTDKNGEIVFKALIPGRYYVRETKASSGYQIDTKRYSVEVFDNSTNTNAETAVLQVTDDPIPVSLGEIVITKNIYASEVIWAHGNPTFQFCVEGTDINGKSHTYHETIVFDPGSFPIAEYSDTNSDDLLSLRVKIVDIPYGNYIISEYETLRYYLEKIEAGSSNASIHQISESRPGARPKDIAYAEVQLTEQEKVAAVSFYNRKAWQQDFSHTAFVDNYIPLPKVSS